MPVNKTKTPEEIEKESDMDPEFEFDPILDILKIIHNYGLLLLGNYRIFSLPFRLYITC